MSYRKLTTNIPVENKPKLAGVETSSSPRSKFIKQLPDGSVSILFEHFGAHKTRGHQCLCKMDTNIRKEIDVFFKKAQQNSCDADSFLHH
jgi:hypothetical protein